MGWIYKLKHSDQHETPSWKWKLHRQTHLGRTSVARHRNWHSTKNTNLQDAWLKVCRSQFQSDSMWRKWNPWSVKKNQFKPWQYCSGPFTTHNINTHCFSKGQWDADPKFPPLKCPWNYKTSAMGPRMGEEGSFSVTQVEAAIGQVGLMLLTTPVYG